MSAAPAQMLTEWLVEQQKVAGPHLQSVKTCITLLEHTTRLADVAEGDIRGLDAAAETVEAPLPPVQLGVSLPGPVRLSSLLSGTPESGSASGGTAAQEEHALGHFMRAERAGICCERSRVSRGHSLAPPSRQALTQTYVTVSKRSEGALAIGGHRRSEQDPCLDRGGLR